MAHVAPAAKMIGTHKELVALFVVVKLVELGRAREQGDDDEEEEVEYDVEVDRGRAIAWAQACASANLAGVVPAAERLQPPRNSLHQAHHACCAYWQRRRC